MYAVLAKSLVIATLTWNPTFATPTVVVDPTIQPPAVAQVESNGIVPVIYLRDDWQNWPKGLLCTVIVHEVGHLDGQKHSSDPLNVMYRAAARTYWRCKRAGYNDYAGL